MNRLKALLVPALAIYSLATPAYAQEDPCADIDVTTKEDSLKAIYYRGGTLPAAPSAAELQALQQLKADTAHPARTKFLEDAFPDNEILQAFAVRDRDGDGISDYRISSCGLFRENDPDVDCDGIANILDDKPYGSVAAPGSQACAAEPDWSKFGQDANNNDLPDKIDWRLTATSAAEKQAADVQERLYKDYKIVLVNRQASIPTDVAIELDQIIRVIFRDQIPRNFPPLRVITADKDMCEGTDWASASSENSTVSMVPETVTDLKPILRLEILVHEIAHTLQYNMDFTTADLLGFRTDNSWNSVKYHEYAKTLGWTADPSSSQTPGLWPVVDNCNPFYPFDVGYKGKSPDEWQSDWDSFSEAKRRSNHMVSHYAGTDAFEWEAEYKAAFVLNGLFDTASRLCKPDEVDELKRLTRADMDTNVFQYANENALGLDSYENVLAPQFKIDEDSWVTLTRTFLLRSYPDVCTE